MSVAPENIVGFLLQVAKNKGLWVSEKSRLLHRRVGPFEVWLQWGRGDHMDYGFDPYAHSSKFCIVDIQVHDMVKTFDEGNQFARDAELWWQLERGVVVYRDPPNLMETLATLAPLDAIAWAAR